MATAWRSLMSVYPLIVLIFLLGGYIYSYQTEWLWVGVWAILSAVLNKLVLKPVSGLLFSKNRGVSLRPRSLELGMPSDHAQGTALVYLIGISSLWVSDLKLLKKGGAMVLLTALSVSVISSRYYYGHHTLLQVIAGTLTGLTLGCLQLRSTQSNIRHVSDQYSIFHRHAKKKTKTNKPPRK